MELSTNYRPFWAIIILFLLAVGASPLPAQTDNLIPAGEDWCGTQKVYEEKYRRHFSEASAPEACDQYGPCDEPSVRDTWVPGGGEPVQYVRMVIHILADDDGQHVFSTPEHVAGQVEQLNLDFAQAGIQFVYHINQVNSTAWRTLQEDEIDDMKNASAIEPDKYLNVWVTVVDFSYSFGTFPWSYDALLPTGGIVMGHFHWLELPHRVFAHEVGHTLGLYHTFHGVDEVDPCTECYEEPGANSSLVGDLCADTPPTPTNQGPCGDFGGDDPCSGLPWGYTMPENYMGYATQSCLTTFTPQQRGRLRCWSNDVLDSWVIPFQVEASVTLGPAPLAVSFAAETHKPATGWHWDFGDGTSSEEQSPAVTFTEPGQRNVAVDLFTADRSYHEEYPAYVGVYADTIDVLDGFFGTSTGTVDIYVRNYLPLQTLTIPITWDGPVEASYSSAWTTGHRSEGMTVSLTSTIPGWNAATFKLDAGQGNFLAPGAGPVLTVRFNLQQGTSSDIMPVSVWDHYTNVLSFASEVGDYVPVRDPGSISFGCCSGLVGNVDDLGGDVPTIGDIAYIIDHLFIGGAPIDCAAEADINQSGGANPGLSDITIGDVSLLVDHLFISGSIPAECL